METEVDSSPVSYQLMEMVFKIWLLSQNQSKKEHLRYTRSQVVDLMMPSLSRYLFTYHHSLITSFINDALGCVEVRTIGISEG